MMPDEGIWSGIHQNAIPGSGHQYWLQGIGLLQEIPGRFISAHLADWSETRKTSVPLDRNRWLERVFASVKKGGVKNIFVEMDEETFKDSAAYLKKS